MNDNASLCYSMHTNVLFCCCCCINDCSGQDRSPKCIKRLSGMCKQLHWFRHSSNDIMIWCESFRDEFHWFHESLAIFLRTRLSPLTVAGIHLLPMGTTDVQALESVICNSHCLNAPWILLFFSCASRLTSAVVRKHLHSAETVWLSSASKLMPFRIQSPLLKSCIDLFHAEKKREKKVQSCAHRLSSYWLCMTIDRGLNSSDTSTRTPVTMDAIKALSHRLCTMTLPSQAWNLDKRTATVFVPSLHLGTITPSFLVWVWWFYMIAGLFVIPSYSRRSLLLFIYRLHPSYDGRSYSSASDCKSFVVKWESKISGKVLLPARSANKPVPGKSTLRVNRLGFQPTKNHHHHPSICTQSLNPSFWLSMRCRYDHMPLLLPNCVYALISPSNWPDITIAWTIKGTGLAGTTSTFMRDHVM